MPAFSEGAQCVLTGGFKGSDGGGPIRRRAISEHLQLRNAPG